MKKNYTSLLSALAIIGILYWVFYSTMPQAVSKNEDLSVFSTQRAFNIVKAISEKPHYIGSENHPVIAKYLFDELKNMGLNPNFQEGYTMTEKGTLSKPKNIIARIKGSDPKFSGNKALLLMAHFDSAPHSFSHGAADDGSGVATILEGVRAFLHNKTAHKNDIFILFTDSEELGLNGAALFVTQHQWAKNIGVAINFEARGSAGPSFMLMEVNNGNAAMVKDFTKANPQFPVSNSLMYSIYKMLPNDTDLTVFRENGKIQGYNFAFIDDHFNYHTAQDDAAHLNLKTLQHQGTYLMPLMDYFSNSDIKNLNSNQDFVYFNTPFGFISYPFAWIFPMWIVAFLLFIGLIVFGLAKKRIDLKQIGKGFIPILISIVAAGLITMFGWKLILKIYPQYNDILHGFTYNGHDYMAAFGLLTLSICFFAYQKFSEKNTTISHYIAPLFIFIVINLLIAIKLKGAAFFIIPVFSGLLILAIYVFTEKTNWFLNVLFAVPTLMLLCPLTTLFPIGLGLKIMFGSCILIVLIFGLLLPIFNSFSYKIIWTYFFLILSIGFFVKAHIYSDYKPGKAKPNSLLYILDADKNTAIWATYDTNLDSWTKGYLGENPDKYVNPDNNQLYSKYNSSFSFSAKAPLKNISKPIITFENDSIVGNRRFLRITISPTRKVNRYDIFANEDLDIAHFTANKTKQLNQNGLIMKRYGRKILSYYVVDNLPLTMEFSIDASKILEMDLMESSFDLLTNPAFGLKKRESWMMPTPFVLNNAVVVKQKVLPTIIVEKVAEIKEENSEILKQ